jgi:nicotinic acid mononucleotide adenylyltransferase
MDMCRPVLDGFAIKSPGKWKQSYAIDAFARSQAPIATLRKQRANQASEKYAYLERSDGCMVVWTSIRSPLAPLTFATLPIKGSDTMLLFVDGKYRCVKSDPAGTKRIRDAYRAIVRGNAEEPSEEQALMIGAIEHGAREVASLTDLATEFRSAKWWRATLVTHGDGFDYKSDDDADVIPIRSLRMPMDTMWPMSKMRERVGVSNAGRPRAVLLTTGGMNPVHRGHVSMLNQAASRLERAGYDVVGAWLSPSHDLYVRPKADNLQTVWLSAPLRVELAEMMVADDPLVAISSWESSTKMVSPPYWIDFPDVCEKLKMELRRELGHLNLGELNVFYVCGTDHAAKCSLYDGLEGHGVVVVPRHGETPGAENARNSVYVAAPAKESGISGISSTALRAALASKDEPLLRTMLSADAVGLLLRPTREQSATFAADFVRLAAMTSKASGKRKASAAALSTHSTTSASTTSASTTSASTTSASTHTKQQKVGVATVAPSVMDSMWLSYKGEGELHGVAFGYTFDKKTLEIKTVLKTVQGGDTERTAKVMVTRCLADASALPKPGPTDSLKAHGISVEKCDIASKMQEPSEKRRVFVLPSQLNAAEYPNETTDKGIVEFLRSYIGDRTGGPAAQLAGDPGVAQFIIDNACNANRPDRGINNVRLMGTIKGVALKNGYLQVQSNADVGTFASNLPNMTVLGVQDVPVRGLVENRYSYAEDKGLAVDLIYASAVPVERYGNIRSPALSRIADLTLFAQYTGSMRLAATRGPCDLYLMLLGGGVFENKRANIRAAIICAYTLMKGELDAKKVTVRVLTYKRDQTGEHKFFDT